MALPSAVQKQADEAERFAVENGLKPGMEPAAGGDRQNSGNAPPAEPAAQPTPAQDPKPKADQEDWETRFKNYKASTDKTISDLRTQLSSSQQQIADSQRQVQDLIQRIQDKPAEQPKSEPSQASGNDLDLDSLPPEIRSEYDDDFLRNMGTLINSQLLKTVGEMKSKLDSLEGTVKQVRTQSEKTAQEQFYEDLDEGESDWERIGTSQEFKDWQLNRVSEIDPRTYAQVLGQAMQEFNARNVLWVLRQYKSSQGGQQDTGDGEPTNQQNLDHLVTPDSGGAGNGGPGLDDQVDTWKQSAVQQFFKDVATTSKYTPQEAKAIERQILAAQKAGKIIPG